MFGKKIIQFYSNPKFGVGMNVWSQVIGLHIKMSTTSLAMGCKGHVKQHTTDHKQGLGFTRIQCNNNNYTLIREGLLISPQIQAHPIPTKINLPKFTRLWCKVWIHNLFFKFTKVRPTRKKFQIINRSPSISTKARRASQSSQRRVTRARGRYAKSKQQSSQKRFTIA